MLGHKTYARLNDNRLGMKLSEPMHNLGQKITHGKHHYHHHEHEKYEGKNIKAFRKR